MPKSQDSKSVHSGVSRTSISVTLPTTDPVVYTGDDADVATGHPTLPPQPPGTTNTAGGAGGGGGGANKTRHGHVKYTQRQLQCFVAVQTIERAWLSYRDHQMFKLLKHAVCAAEHSLSHEILRKVCPKEAEFFKDKAMLSKVRFRFGGSEFPPIIYFKVYAASSNGMSLRYLSGKKMIQPASEAARDACELMGHRKFYDQMIQDYLEHQGHMITGEVDVTTLKDYMKYCSLIDETPSYMGGKDNSWRKLTLEVLPRQTIFYDVVDFLYHRKITPRLKEELPALLKQPTNESAQLQHIEIISQLRPISPLAPLNTPKTAKTPNEGQSSRRSRQARTRAGKMKQIYEQEKHLNTMRSDLADENVQQQNRSTLLTDDHEGDNEEWEQEANKLFEWTQELSFEELTMTPRLTGSFVR